MHTQSLRTSITYHRVDDSVFKLSDVFQCMLDSQNDGIGLLDENYVLEYSNPALGSFLGSEEQNYIGKKIQFNHGLNSRQLLQIHRALTKHGMWTGIISKQGKTLSVRISRVALTNTAAQKLASNVYFMISVSDHSSTMKQQEELAQANKAVEKLSVEKTEFLSQTGHELRTPLNAVVGFAQLLQSDTGMSTEQQDYIDEIMQASSYLLNVINRILNISKAEHDHAHLKLVAERIDTTNLISECIALVDPLAKKANVSIAQSNFKACLTKDKVRLKQVLLNLISNAIKYNREGGRVVIQSFYSAPRIVRIEVQDTGNGIPADLLKTVFNPFERLGIKNGEIEGTGIGLMITRRLVKLMNGKAHVVSEPDRGSIFSLDFLLSDDEIDSQSTVLSEIARDIVWIGKPSHSQRYSKRLTSLRPALEFQHLNTVEEAVMLSADRVPGLVFVCIDELCTQYPTLTMRDQNLLKQCPLVVVLSASSSFDDQGELGLQISGHLPSHFTAVEFMEIVDNHFYR